MKVDFSFDCTDWTCAQLRQDLQKIARVENVRQLCEELFLLK
jgi:hypothetical protein